MNRKKVRIFTNGLLLIGLVTCSFGLFQHISVLYGLNPVYINLYNLFHNTLVYSSFPVTTSRVNSFFNEPSFFSAFCSMLFVIIINKIIFEKKYWLIVPLPLVFYCLLVSYSTTGYIAAILGIMLTVVEFILQKRTMTEKLPLILVIIIPLLLILTFLTFYYEGTLASLTQNNNLEATAHLSTNNEFLNQTVKKSGGISFRNRLWADEFSIFTILPKTYFLGAGFGSNRPSSLFASILSNDGIIGMTFFLLFLFFLLRFGWRNIHKLKMDSIILFIGFSTYLFALFIAIPDINWPPYLWLVGGLLFASFQEQAAPQLNDKPVKAKSYE